MILNREPDEEVLHAIELYTLCKEFHVLPRPGGLLDQDYYEVMLLKRAAEAYVEKQNRDMKKK